MKSRWDDADAARAVADHGPRWGEDLALRVYSSRLLGADATLVLHGGGNTSVKTVASERTGEVVEVLAVKGSGWDLATIEPPGFPICRLAPLLELAHVDELSDEDMVRGLRANMLDPASPTPSVEALLHACLPGMFVDHTHSDAVLAIVDQPDAEARSRDVWGDRALFVPYVMPGFALAKAIARLGSALLGADLLVLDKHGMFSWGETARESYERMIDAVTAAEARVTRAFASMPPPATRTDEKSTRRQRRVALAPLLRGAFARADRGMHVIVEWRSEDAILDLLARPDAPEVTQIGPITPDHVIRTKPKPLFLPELSDDLPQATSRAVVESGLAAYSRSYDAYVARGERARGREVRKLDPLPRLVAIPGLGVATIATSRKDARIAGDLYAHTAKVIVDALALGEYRPVTELDLFDVEYWSLEQQKLTLGKGAAGPLAARIALVTGAAKGIGRATSLHLAELGAHVVLTDANPEALEATTRELRARFGAARVEHEVVDVTNPTHVARAIDTAVSAFGGIDIVVSNAGSAPSGLLHDERGDRALRDSLELNLLAHQAIARAASEVMVAQGTGGALLFNASKSAFAPGPEFGPYAIPKAALIALMRQYAVDLGAHNIRANAVNADRIRTDLFGGGVLEERARARGLSPEDYFRANLLRRETTAEDVAHAFGFLATAEGTTGCVVTVDGGNPAAFPR